MVPQHIGRYEIKAELGRGGMATVYRAYDPHFERDVAIKVLPEQFLHDPTFLTRFDQEARVIARLEQRNILPVYDFGEADGLPFIVMRLMPHGSLHDRLIAAPGPGLPLPDIVRFVRQIAKALDFAHAHGVIHRDLKPDNVLLDETGNAYLSDFGIAKVIEASMTFSGTMVVGTPSYMAPEQARGEKPTAQTDVYALGAMAFELLAGRPPFEADDIAAMLFKHVYEPVPLLADLRTGLPDELQGVIGEAMAKELEFRYQHAGDMAAAMARAVAGGTPPPVVATPEPAQPAQAEADRIAAERAETEILPQLPSVQRRGIPLWGWFAGGVIAILLIVGLLGLGGGALLGGVASRSNTPAPTPIGGGGSQIAFYSDRDGDFEIYVMGVPGTQADGSGQTNLTNHAADDFWPAWSPDGSQIVFYSLRDGNS